MSTTKVTVTIKVPSQNLTRHLEVPELEVETLVDDILTQCEQYDPSLSQDDDDYEDSEDFE